MLAETKKKTIILFKNKTAVYQDKVEFVEVLHESTGVLRRL